MMNQRTNRKLFVNPPKWQAIFSQKDNFSTVSIYKERKSKTQKGWNYLATGLGAGRFIAEDIKEITLLMQLFKNS